MLEKYRNEKIEQKALPADVNGISRVPVPLSAPCRCLVRVESMGSSELFSDRDNERTSNGREKERQTVRGDGRDG